MPELPDLTVYIEHLSRRLVGRQLVGIRLASPFVLRTVTPTIETFAGRGLVRIERLAKQLVLVFDDEHLLVLHLMISGRLQWRDAGGTSGSGGKAPKIPARIGLLALDFETGSVFLTEVSKKKRASIRLFKGLDALNDLDPGGLDTAGLDLEDFSARLQQTSHTLKRTLTDQHVFAGIGNAYSDEILHRARLSPFKLARSLESAEVEVLYRAVHDVLAEWTVRLRAEAGDAFPSRVTAFHEQMAVHGKYRQPCPVCSAPVQRIQYAENESNYCARCQTGGRVLADRSLSRLLKDNWPKRIEELE